MIDIFAKKKQLMQLAVEKLEVTKQPVLIVITENTANIWNCILSDELLKVRQKNVKAKDIYLEHPNGGLIKHFEDNKWAIIYEDKYQPPQSWFDGEEEKLFE